MSHSGLKNKSIKNKSSKMSNLTNASTLENSTYSFSKGELTP